MLCRFGGKERKKGGREGREEDRPTLWLQLTGLLTLLKQKGRGQGTTLKRMT